MLLPPPGRITALVLILIVLSLTAACVPVTPVPSATGTALPVPAVTAVLLATSTSAPVVAVPTDSTPPSAPCAEPAGTLQNSVIDDPRLPKPMRYIVYLPPCYAQTDTRYPVLYLLHGLGYTEDQWVRLGAADTADALIAGGEIAPFLLVMPYNYGIEQPASDPFDEVLLDSLIPRIDAEYRTLPGREFRAVGGLSRGGGWALHLGIRQYELFGIVGAHAPAIFYADSASLKMRLQQIPPGLRPRLFIDIGDADQQLRDAQRLADLLDELNIDHEWRLNIGAHTEDYWRAHVADYLRWYGRQFSGN